MGGTRRSNKARNQTRGNRRGVDDADWHKKNSARSDQRRKMARQARRKNRKKR